MRGLGPYDGDPVAENVFAQVMQVQVCSGTVIPAPSSVFSGTGLASGWPAYSWQEQGVTTPYAVYSGVTAARRGQANLFEVNNLNLLSGCPFYATAWLRAVVSGQPCYEFNGAPHNVSDASGGVLSGHISTQFQAVSGMAVTVSGAGGNALVTIWPAAGGGGGTDTTPYLCLSGLVSGSYQCTSGYPYKVLSGTSYVFITGWPYPLPGVSTDWNSFSFGAGPYAYPLVSGYPFQPVNGFGTLTGVKTLSGSLYLDVVSVTLPTSGSYNIWAQGCARNTPTAAGQNMNAQMYDQTISGVLLPTSGTIFLTTDYTPQGGQAAGNYSLMAFYAVSGKTTISTQINPGAGTNPTAFGCNMFYTRCS